MLISSPATFTATKPSRPTFMPCRAVYRCQFRLSIPCELDMRQRWRCRYRKPDLQVRRVRVQTNARAGAPAHPSRQIVQTARVSALIFLGSQTDSIHRQPVHRSPNQPHPPTQRDWSTALIFPRKSFCVKTSTCLKRKLAILYRVGAKTPLRLARLITCLRISKSRLFLAP